MTDRLEQIEKNTERTYDHPNISPWHVREALRDIVALLREQQAEISKLRNQNTLRNP